MVARWLNKIPSQHASEVGETYLEHMRFALRTSKVLFKASVYQAVHAFLPDRDMPDRYSLTGMAHWTLMEAFKRGAVVQKGD